MDEFDYPLPAEAIAQAPVTPRDRARLLVATGPTIAHQRVADLPAHVGPGDVVVVNDSRVLPARLLLRKPTGGEVEVLLLEPGASDVEWEALVRPSRRVAAGTVLEAGPDLAVEVGPVLGDGRRLVTLRCPGDVVEALSAHGRLPLPPYISGDLQDPERYQTVYSRRPTSVAAPTAGLHLTTEVLDRCRAAGASVERVELAVGLATFRPVTADDPADHRMHSERYSVPEATLAACQAARSGGHRVLAVGTTTVRALEAAARGPLSGRTDLFIRRPFDFLVVDRLLTNFHLPRSSLLLLVDAFAGPRWRELYDTALAEGYRFLSFGDAMLLDSHVSWR